IPGCGVAPRQAGEQIGAGRIAVTSGVTLYVPPGADVLPSDRFEVRGVEYEVDGEPAVWRSPFTGWEPGREVVLTRVEEGAAGWLVVVTRPPRRGHAASARGSSPRRWRSWAAGRLRTASGRRSGSRPATPATTPTGCK